VEKARALTGLHVGGLVMKHSKDHRDVPAESRCWTVVRKRLVGKKRAGGGEAGRGYSRSVTRWGEGLGLARVEDRLTDKRGAEARHVEGRGQQW